MDADAQLLRFLHDERACVPKTCAHCKLERAEGRAYRTLKLTDDTSHFPGAEAWGVDPNGSKF
jgi:hypothetical protein